MDAHIDIHAQARLCDGGLRRKIQQIGGRYIDIRPLLFNLIGLIAKHRHKLLHRGLNQARMGHPATVVAVGCIATLITDDALHGDLVFLGIVFDRNQRTHAADGGCIAFVTGLQQQQGIGPHKGGCHGDFRPIRQAEFVIHFELLDAREDVIPAACI